MILKEPNLPDEESGEEGEEEDEVGDSLSKKGPGIRNSLQTTFKSKRGYRLVPLNVKRELIKRVDNGLTIKEASLLLDINYSTAKHIVKLYKSTRGAPGRTNLALIDSYQ
jgi:hypothetical protein